MRSIVISGATEMEKGVTIVSRELSLLFLVHIEVHKLHSSLLLQYPMQRHIVAYIEQIVLPTGLYRTERFVVTIVT